MSEPRIHRAGERIEDLCRACKAMRDHTIMAVDGDGRVLRVVCGFCGSAHHYRHGGGDAPRPSAGGRDSARPGRAPLPLVSERERVAPPLEVGEDSVDLEMLLRRIIREETGLTPVAPADRWRGGQLLIRSADGSVQDKSWPIETFFHKIVMMRNRLRTLEQQLNGADIPEDLKVKLQGYVTGCYGSLTSFNVLFADEADHFKGAGGD